MEDVPLPMKNRKKVKTFHLIGPKSGITTWTGDNPIVTYSWKKRWPSTEKHWNYVLTFPAPDYIYGLVPEYVKIHEYPNSSKNNHYALRFRYNDSDDPQFDEFKINANHLGGTDPSYCIEIRYNHFHSVVRRKMDFFADATRCFKSMRKNLPPCDRWKPVFEEDAPQSTVQRRNRPKMVIPGGPAGPHDCGAPVMALQDGVLLEGTIRSQNSR